MVDEYLLLLPSSLGTKSSTLSLRNAAKLLRGFSVKMSGDSDDYIKNKSSLSI